MTKFITRFRFEQLEHRLTMAADADIVIDIWPGPLHSDPEIIGKVGDALYFTAETPDGYSIMQTRGEGFETMFFDTLTERPETVLHGEELFAIGPDECVYHFENGGVGRVSNSTEWLQNDETIYWVETTYSDIEDGQRLATTAYSDIDGRNWTASENVYCDGDGSCNETTEYYVHGVVGQSAIVSTANAVLGDFSFVASGDTWLPIEWGMDYSSLTDDGSTRYAIHGTELGQVTEAGYTPFFDIATREFPTDFLSFDHVESDSVFVTLYDEVFGTASYRISEGTIVQEEPPVITEPDPVYYVGNGFAVYDYTFETGRELAIRQILPGDANLDGFFDSADLLSLFQLGEYEDDIAGNSTQADGDFNGDSEFDSSDLVDALAQGWYRG